MTEEAEDNVDTAVGTPGRAGCAGKTPRFPEPVRHTNSPPFTNMISLRLQKRPARQIPSAPLYG